MHPLIPSASPFTLAEDSSLSPTFCSSLDPCSSHGFSSLQSPSAFPSFFSNDSSHQVEALQPLSLDSAELCCCHLQHCCGEVSLDIGQDESVSQSNLNIVTSEEGPLLHHTDSQKLVSPFHSSAYKTSNRNCESLQKDLGFDRISRGSLFQERASAEHSISLPSYLSSLQDGTESFEILPIQGGNNEKNQTVLSECNFQSLSSSPDPREQLALLHTKGSNDKNCYAFHSQIDKIPRCESFETHSCINDTDYIDAHSKHNCYKNSCIMPRDVVSSVLTTSTLIARNEDAGDKENHINGSRIRQVQPLDKLAPLCSDESKLDHIRRGGKEALQEIHQCKKTMYFPCKELFIDTNATDEASKENISPHVFKQAHKKVGGVKADSSGWICPKDAKKKFKPKPRQLLLDKWLARQR